MDRHSVNRSKDWLLKFDVHKAVHRNKTNKMHHLIKFILFWNDTLHVSDGLSVHRQEFKAVCTATGRYCCLLASNQTAISVWQMPVAVCTVFNSRWWTERPSETCRVSFQNKINVDTLVHLVGFAIEIISKNILKFIRAPKALLLGHGGHGVTRWYYSTCSASTWCTICSTAAPLWNVPLSLS